MTNQINFAVIDVYEPWTEGDGERRYAYLRWIVTGYHRTCLGLVVGCWRLP